MLLGQACAVTSAVGLAAFGAVSVLYQAPAFSRS